MNYSINFKLMTNLETRSEACRRQIETGTANVKAATKKISSIYEPVFRKNTSISPIESEKQNFLLLPL